MFETFSQMQLLKLPQKNFMKLKIYIDPVSFYTQNEHFKDLQRIKPVLVMHTCSSISERKKSLFLLLLVIVLHSLQNCVYDIMKEANDVNSGFSSLFRHKIRIKST